MSNAVSDELVPTAIIGTPFVLNGTLINATLSASPLRKRTNYICEITATVSGNGSSKPVTVVMKIKVIF